MILRTAYAPDGQARDVCTDLLTGLSNCRQDLWTRSVSLLSAVQAA
jgi:hypothetical protein